MPNVKTGAKSPTLPEAIRLKIAYRKAEDLRPYAGNARTHSDKQIEQIAASIRQFGFGYWPRLGQGPGHSGMATRCGSCNASSRGTPNEHKAVGSDWVGGRDSGVPGGLWTRE